MIIFFNKVRLIFRKNTTKEQGFTLLEIMISMSIFSLIIGGVVLFSVRTLEAHTKSQAMKNAVENARFAIETLNKKIRTSHEINDGGSSNFSQRTEIFFIDNVDDSKNCYRFNNATFVLEAGKLPESSAVASCGPGFTFEPIVGGPNVSVEGNFYVKGTDESSNERGFVRSVVDISYKELSGIVSEKDSIIIQSSVSIRDY